MKAIRSQNIRTLVGTILLFYGIAGVVTLVTLAVLGRVTWSALGIGIGIGIGCDLILGRLQSAKSDTNNHASK